MRRFPGIYGGFGCFRELQAAEGTVHRLQLPNLYAHGFAVRTVYGLAAGPGVSAYANVSGSFFLTNRPGEFFRAVNTDLLFSFSEFPILRHGDLITCGAGSLFPLQGELLPARLAADAFHLRRRRGLLHLRPGLGLIRPGLRFVYRPGFPRFSVTR